MRNVLNCDANNSYYTKQASFSSCIMYFLIICSAFVVKKELNMFLCELPFKKSERIKNKRCAAEKNTMFWLKASVCLLIKTCRRPSRCCYQL